MNSKTQSMLLACLVVIGTESGLQAGPIIYDNGNPLLVSGFFADVAIEDGITIYGGLQPADDFQLEQGRNVIGDIHWWGNYGWNGPLLPTDNFTIYILDDNNGLPGNVLLTIPVGDLGRTDTGNDVLPNCRSCPSDHKADVFAYSYDLPFQIILTPETTYWLSILNDTRGDPGGEWFWSQTDTSSGNAAVFPLPSVAGPQFPLRWQHQSGLELAFNLTAYSPITIPDTAGTLSLLALGITGLLGCRCRGK